MSEMTPSTAPQEQQATDIEAEMDSLAADAEYLASINPEDLSPEDKQAYDELVARRQAEYQANAEAIHERNRQSVRANDSDRQHRIDSGDHNAR